MTSEITDLEEFRERMLDAVPSEGERVELDRFFLQHVDAHNRSARGCLMLLLHTWASIGWHFSKVREVLLEAGSTGAEEIDDLVRFYRAKYPRVGTDQ